MGDLYQAHGRRPDPAEDRGEDGDLAPDRVHVASQDPSRHAWYGRAEAVGHRRGGRDVFPPFLQGPEEGHAPTSAQAWTEVEKARNTKDKVCVLTATDRRRGRFLRSACLGRMSVDDLRRLFEDPVEWSDSVLVTDGHRAYATLAKERETPHTALKGGRGRGSLHIQTVNSLHSHLKEWIRPFRGVATKYIDHYLLYFRRRAADPFPVLVAKDGWTSAASLRGRRMELV